MVRVTLPRFTATPLGLFPRSRRLEVVGLFRVGAEQDAEGDAEGAAGVAGAAEAQAPADGAEELAVVAELAVVGVGEATLPQTRAPRMAGPKRWRMAKPRRRRMGRPPR